MSARLRPPIGDDDHALGPATAPVTLVEYGDLECPHCGRAYPIVEGVRRKLGDELRFVFRHFPLSEIHPHAQLAAEACEAAAEQRSDAFWAMHHYCFEHQDALDADALVAQAARIGLDVQRFTEDLRARRLGDRVMQQVESGLRSGVNGTPTFFINGDRMDAPWDAPSLMRELRAARDRVATGA
jgi:protein-disulfide isomerase